MRRHAAGGAAGFRTVPRKERQEVLVALTVAMLWLALFAAVEALQ